MSDTPPTPPWTALRDARAAAGLSQAQLASRIGSSPLVIAHLEAGRHRPSLRRIYELAAALGMDPAELFRGIPAVV